nr:uncharacterized protein LOC109151360 isoform X3 [Ipomoea batatas]
MRPAASFYHAADNCLYIADSENHAIRRADMGRRILDTLYPAMNSNKDSNRLWSWIFGKLWSRKDIEAKSDEFPPKTLLFPWHISKCQNDLFVLNHNLQTLWILDLASGALQEIVEGMEATAKALHYLLLVTISSTTFYTLKDSRIYRRSVGILYWRSQIFLNKYQMIC